MYGSNHADIASFLGVFWVDVSSHESAGRDFATYRCISIVVLSALGKDQRV